MFTNIFLSSGKPNFFLSSSFFSGIGLNLSRSIPLSITANFSGKKFAFFNLSYTSLETTTILSAAPYLKCFDNQEGTLPERLTATIFGLCFKNGLTILI